ncbi:MAG: hypothetical protein LUE99_06540 [Bacteroides sp.]|nr:hypothetical protein [Bacteroides sp.]
MSCADQRQKKAALLNRDLQSLPILSTEFNSLLRETESLSVQQRVNILLNISYRDEIKNYEVQKQEHFLLEALKLSPAKEKKRILLQLVRTYQALEQSRIAGATSKGIKRCEELESSYSLSQEEELQIKRTKILFFNKEGRYKESLPILYTLLEKHRSENNALLIIEDLCAIANLFTRLGDLEKGLEVL